MNKPVWFSGLLLTILAIVHSKLRGFKNYKLIFKKVLKRVFLMFSQSMVMTQHTQLKLYSIRSPGGTNQSLTIFKFYRIKTYNP